MTAGLGRALGLAGAGVVGGLALVAAFFGTGDLLERARSLVAPAETPRRAADLPATGPQGEAGKPAGRDAGTGERPGNQAAIDPHAAPDWPPQAESRGEGGASGSRPAPAPGQAPAETAKAPSLDLIRVEPTGETVIAGRGAPNAAVEVLRDNQPIARAVADESGQFAIVPPALPPGNSEITLRAVGADGKAVPGKESVAVVVAKERDAQPLVAVSEPDKPTRVLSQPEAPAQAKIGPDAAKTAEAGRSPKDATKEPAKDKGDKAAAKLGDNKPGDKPSDKPEAPLPQREAALKADAKPATESVPVKIVAVDAQEGGRLFVSGQATAWASLRLYLNDTLVASGRSGADGRIAFTIGRGVRPGGYQIRIDQVESESGKVRNRAQVAFAFPAQLAAKEPVKEPVKIAGREPSGREAAARAPSPDTPPSGPKPVAEPAAPERSSQGMSQGQSARERPAEKPAAQEKAAQEKAAQEKTAKEQQAASGQQAAQQKPAQEKLAQEKPAQEKPPQDKAAQEKPAASREAAAPAAPPSPQQSAPKPEAAPGEPPQRAGGGKTAEAPSSATPAAQAPSPEKPAAGSASRPETEAGGRTVASPEPGKAGGAAGAMAEPRASPAEAPPPDRPGSVFVPEITTARIIRGDNLWQISRRTYGDGKRYTVIYDANQEQIRDPDLIYPGQIFVLPKDEPAADRQGAKRG